MVLTFLYFWKGMWILMDTLCIADRLRGKDESYPGELFLVWKLWIGARSYFRKCWGGVILERNKAAPGYVIERQDLIFWWNEGTAKKTSGSDHFLFLCYQCQNTSMLVKFFTYIPSAILLFCRRLMNIH